MSLSATRTRRLACLLGVLQAGEQLAAATAAQQARLAPLPWMRRALVTQAEQERRHAAIARGAWHLVGASSCASSVPDVCAGLRARLAADLARGDLAASLIGLQGVIEHLGEALLEFLGQHPHPAGAVLHPLRRHVLAQERAHMLLGARCRRALPAPRDTTAFDTYRALGHAAALDVAGLLDDAHLEADAYWRDVQRRLRVRADAS
jgi:hypothetical protein